MKRSRWLCAFSFGALVMSKSPRDPAYHIFVDEYGDQSLSRKSPEWFIVSAVIVASHRERDLPKWTDRINQQRRNSQGSALHFTELDERTKLWATRFVGRMPLRCFSVMSHKANMYTYRNVRAERAADLRSYNDDGTSFATMPRRKLWYSHSVLKYLLERTTEWCADRSMRDYKEHRPVQITIAQRGGFYLDKFKVHLQRDHRNWMTKIGVHYRYLAWPVVDLELISTAPAANVAGLQLADIVSGSFSRAVDQRKFGTCDTRFVSNIGPRISRKGPGRQIAGWGITGLPWELWQADLSEDQEAVFRYFGYGDGKLVRPGPILPADW